MSLVKIIALLLDIFAGQYLDKDKIATRELGVRRKGGAIHGAPHELCLHLYILQKQKHEPLRMIVISI